MRKNNTLVKRLMAVIMMVAMAVAVLPQSVQAATVSITPGYAVTFTGDTIQLKIKGLKNSYKKITWKSSNKNAVSVNSKGKATAKGSGSAYISATITLKNGKKVTAERSRIRVDAKQLMVIEEADNQTAEQVKDYLDSTTPFSLVYLGSEQDAADLVSRLRTKIGKLNEYGVLFQYSDYDRYSPGVYMVDGKLRKGYRYQVTKEDCKLYQYSVKFYKKLVAQIIGDLFADETLENNESIYYQNGKLAFARKFDTWQEYIEALKEYDPWIRYEDGSIRLKDNYEDIPDYFPISWDDNDDLRRCWLLANTKFCDLSQAMKVWAISHTGFFAGAEWGRELGVLCMVYGDPAGASREQSEMTQMKYMAENKAVGVCEDYARYEVTAFKQLGIKAEFAHDGGHAWSVVYPTNADGKKLQYIFNYRLEYDDDSCHGHSGSKSDIY